MVSSTSACVKEKQRKGKTKTTFFMEDLLIQRFRSSVKIDFSDLLTQVEA